MSMRFQCPACSAIHSVNAQAVGRRIRCPDCHELVSISPLPAGAAEGAESLAAEADDLIEIEDLEPEDVASETNDADAVLSPAELKPLARVYLTPPPIAVPPPAQRAAGAAPPPAPAGGMARAGAVRRRPALLRKRSLPEAEMDMTPMVDVTFQLLIFFMLTASFTMQKSLSVPKPQANQAAAGARTLEDFQQNPDYVVVRVDSFNTFHVSSALWDDEIEAPSEQELLVKLRQARKGDAAGNMASRMLVIASGEALHDRVVTAIDAGNEVGMDEVQLVTAEDEQ